MRTRIIAETPKGQQATAFIDINENAPCSLEYVRDGEKGIANFKNFATAQTAAIRALHSDLGFTYLHVKQARIEEIPLNQFEGHGHWFQTLKQHAAA